MLAKSMCIAMYLREHASLFDLIFYLPLEDVFSSMTSLFTHDVAHCVRHSFRPKTNNQPFNVFESYVQLSKSLQKWDVILEKNKIEGTPILKLAMHIKFLRYRIFSSCVMHKKNYVHLILQIRSKANDVIKIA